MYVQQLYTTCLSEAAYFIESNGEAAVVDPLRDIDTYLQLARERKATIKYIFETHFHADFVSGHLDLAKATGATIVYGPHTQAGFAVHVAKEGEKFLVGNATVEVLHTPGHTLESSCYLLKNEDGNDYCVFTGDTLFVGDVGRPDLAQSTELTQEDLAGMLYDSIQAKLLPLADHVIVYPAHGPGSACGKSFTGKESTIGDERRANYALLAGSKEEFIKAVTEGLTAPPQYFPINAKINKEGYESFSAVLENALQPLSVADVRAHLQDNGILLDTRPTDQFTQGFIPGSIFIGLEGRFAEWAGSLLPFDNDIVLVTEPGKEKEAVTRLARVGFSRVVGYADGGVDAWRKAGEEMDMIIDVEADELAMDIPFDENLVVVDVRRPAEYAAGHVKDAVNIPLNDLADPVNMSNLEENQNIYVHCAGGYRSVVATSLLKRQGIHNIRNVVGGWNKIREEKKIKTEMEKSVLN
ncbi:MAG TPA: rhodanese-like domain-containing protein [Flavisolibacter sp.]|nr:rhodanese-like domain-containing protein [Flavisolibacter sp.]